MRNNRMRLIDVDKLVWRTQLRLDRTMLDVDFVFKEDIDAMPTIEAEPIEHGYWIGSWSEKYHVSSGCSICKCISPEPFKYCPNCGAKMDKEKQ